MSKVEEIKAAIDQLSLEERVELAALMAGEFPDDDWDKLMRQTAASGKFDAINAQADAAVRAGRCIDLNSGQSS